MDKTTYRRPAKREDAPEVTDCLTSIYYIFRKAIGISIPVTYIGDMPRELLRYSEWKPLCISQEDAQYGDLLFVKNRNKPKLLSHVALILDPQFIFHCSPEGKATAVIQEWGTFFANYEQRLPFSKAVRYIDSRNQLKRDQEGDIFIGS